MGDLFKRLGWIIFIHIMFMYVNVRISMMTYSLNDFKVRVYSFLAEPIIIFTFGVVILYVLICFVLKRKPELTRKEKFSLIIVSMICTVLTLQPIVIMYIDAIVKDGFSIFIFKDWWVR